MKKLFIILAVAGTLTACNNNADSTIEKKDSIDSIANEKKDMIDSTAELRKEAIDSAAEQKKEVIEREDSTLQHDTSHTKH